MYWLNMKSNRDTLRQSSIQCVMKQMKAKGGTIVIYESTIEDGNAFFCRLVVNDWEKFKSKSQAIIANHCIAGFAVVKDKVYTMDFYGRDRGINPMNIRYKTFFQSRG